MGLLNVVLVCFCSVVINGVVLGRGFIEFVIRRCLIFSLMLGFCVMVVLISVCILVLIVVGFFLGIMWWFSFSVILLGMILVLLLFLMWLMLR